MTGRRTATIPFRAAYASALDQYLRAPSETSLHVAYELGRDAVGRHLSVLDLAVAHQEALQSALAEASEPADSQRVAQAAGDFFLEGLSTFEMVQRGFGEAQEAASLERRQTELSRQLSSFLGDASLAFGAEDSLQEMLRLVSELARELVDADCCVATVTAERQPRAAEAASHSDEPRWPAFVRWLDLVATYRLLRARGGSLRLAGEELAILPRAGGARAPQLRGWLAASLTTLDGGELGAIQLFDKQGGAFTAEDEAALVHLAQTASAAVERARLYRNPG
jgi:phosphoserine phosphatase RsbU-like protein/GAF domain-containing protein